MKKIEETLNGLVKQGTFETKISLNVDIKVKEELDNLAFRYNTTVSHIVRIMINKELDEI